MEYIVRPSDTLFLIAQRFGVTLNQLIAANPQITDPNRIYIGQRIFIPVITPPNTQVYIVQPGDTMFLIARRFGLPLNQLIAANPQIPNPNLIYVGQRVYIPITPLTPVPDTPNSCLVFVSTRSSRPEIWRSNQIGQNELQLTRGQGTVESPVATPQWSPDGRYIGFQVSRQLVVITACGREILRLPVNPQFFSWSYDSRQIAYSNDDGSYIADLQGQTRLVAPNLFNPVWFPGDRRLAGYTTVEDIMFPILATVSTTGEDFTVFDTPPVPATVVKISPNGRYAATQLQRGYAFGEFSSVWVYDFATNVLVELPGFEVETSPGFVRNLSFLGGWAPDSSRLVYSTLIDPEIGAGEIRIATPVGLVQQRFRLNYYPLTNWGPFADWIIYTRNTIEGTDGTVPRQIFIYNLVTREEIRVTNEGSNYEPDWLGLPCLIC